MDALPEIELLAAAIRNAAWSVRYYRRPIMRAQRAAAVRALGLACRDAFNQSEDFEALLVAIVAGLTPRDDSVPF